MMRNAGFMLVTQLGTWTLALLLTVVMPRFLGPANYGEFALAGAAWAVASILMVFGTDAWVLNSVARDPAAATRIMPPVFWWRVLVYPAAAVAIGAYLLFSGASRETHVFVQLVGVSTLLAALLSLMVAVLQARQEMQHIALAVILGKATNTLLAILLLIAGAGISGVAAAGVLATLVSLALAVRALAKSGSVDVRPRLTGALRAIRSGAPFAMNGVVGTTYLQVNTLIIGSMSKAEVGWYGVALAVFSTLLFLPVAVSDALVPVFARLHAHAPAQLPSLVRRGLEVILIAVVPAALGLCAVAPPLVTLVWGAAFAPSGPALQVLALGLIVMSVNILMARYLAAIDRPLVWTQLMVAALVVRVGATLYLVPLSHHRLGNGAIGGAGGLLLSELFMTVAGLFYMPAGSLGWGFASKVARIFACGGATFLTAYSLRQHAIVLPVLAGALAYAASALALRVLSDEDKGLARELAGKLWSRVRRVVPAGPVS
jgi:O-antigen/teichoic acid export membrane protein